MLEIEIDNNRLVKLNWWLWKTSSIELKAFHHFKRSKWNYSSLLSQSDKSIIYEKAIDLNEQFERLFVSAPSILRCYLVSVWFCFVFFNHKWINSGEFWPVLTTHLQMTNYFMKCFSKITLTTSNDGENNESNKPTIVYK